MLVVGYRFTRSGRRWWAGYSAVTAVVFLAGFVLAAMGFAQTQTFVSIGGLLQRLTVVVGLAWITALALLLIRRSPGVFLQSPATSYTAVNSTPSRRPLG